MIKQIILIINIITIYEILFSFNFFKLIKKNVNFYKKIFSLLKFKRVSDYRKEKVLFNYSKNLFLISLKIIFILMICLLIIFISNLLVKDFYSLLFSIIGFFEVVILTYVYIWIKKKLI